MNSNKEILLSLIKKHVEDIDPSAEIILYGSRARGDARPDSDWDILILTDKEVDNKSEQVFRHSLYDVALELEEALSTFVYNKQEWNSKRWMTPFYKNIAKEGIRI